MSLFELIKSIYYTALLYLSALVSLLGPGTMIWQLFGHRKGKVPLLSRDLICDSETLLSLPKCSKPLDGFTNALCPFLPTFLLDSNDEWKQRREVFSHANNLINQRIQQKHFHTELQGKQGNLLWDLFENLSRFAFELVFNRSPTPEEFEDIYPGLLDINQIIKRFTSKAHVQKRENLYKRVLRLIEENDKDFVFHDCPSFFQMSELHQVSSVAEDFLTTIAVQCTDLICHMLLLYAEHPNEFIDDPDNALSETLRLYPLTDLWTREASENHRGWLTSLVQLNRNGWVQPDRFYPQRFQSKEHPPLMSWGFDVRRCPAQKLATNLSKLVFQNLIQTDQFWIVPAKNFEHERTFPYGVQVSIGYGPISKDVYQWKFPHKLRMQWRRWLCEKLRMIDQQELN